MYTIKAIDDEKELETVVKNYIHVGKDMSFAEFLELHQTTKRRVGMRVTEFAKMLLELSEEKNSEQRLRFGFSNFCEPSSYFVSMRNEYGHRYAALFFGEGQYGALFPISRNMTKDGAEASLSQRLHNWINHNGLFAYDMAGGEPIIYVDLHKTFDVVRMSSQIQRVHAYDKEAAEQVANALLPGDVSFDDPDNIMKIEEV